MGTQFQMDDLNSKNGKDGPDPQRCILIVAGFQRGNRHPGVVRDGRVNVDEVDLGMSATVG